MNELLDILEDKFKYTINPSLYFFLLVTKYVVIIVTGLYLGFFR